MNTTDKKIVLNFGSFSLDAILFNDPVAERFYDSLPVTINLTAWGDEVYGAIPARCGAHNPVPRIPAGGIAYTEQGSYLCIFFGQDPAWAVEHIGQIEGESWKKLPGHTLKQVVVSKKTL